MEEQSVVGHNVGDQTPQYPNQVCNQNIAQLLQEEVASLNKRSIGIKHKGCFLQQSINKTHHHHRRPISTKLREMPHHLHQSTVVHRYSTYEGVCKFITFQGSISLELRHFTFHYMIKPTTSSWAYQQDLSALGAATTNALRQILPSYKDLAIEKGVDQANARNWIVTLRVPWKVHYTKMTL